MLVFLWNCTSQECVVETNFTDEEIKTIVEKTALQHIAIIMDGNRRWAKEHHLPSAIGHQKGVEALRATLRACAEFGIRYLTVYAFSTENWKRNPEEVNFLMNLLASTLTKELDELHRENVKIKFIGSIAPLDEKLKKTITNAEETTQNNTGVNLQIAFNYGSRDEITRAVKEIAAEVEKKEISPAEITEDFISGKLYTAGMPDPDLIIRTGGEYRISNYLLWQAAYSEIIILDEFWPEFDKKLLARAVSEFERRNRRYGK